MKSENYLKLSTGFAFLLSFFLSFYSMPLTVTVQLLSRVQVFATLWTVCSPPGSPVHGILQARMLEWVAISSSRGSS